MKELEKEYAINKEKSAIEYAKLLQKEVEEYYGKNFDPKNAYFGNGDICLAFEAGWDACMKYVVNKDFLTKIAERIKKSKPMPADFSKIIDEDFWNLVDKQ